MTRLATDKAFFKKEVLDNSVLNAYYLRMQERPSYKEAGQYQHHLWTKTKANLMFTSFMAIFSAVPMVIELIFKTQLGID